MTEEFEWCPHCQGGRLEKSKSGYDYDCIQCDRGFRIDKKTGTWHAIGDDQRSTYTAESVQRAQEYWKRHGR